MSIDQSKFSFLKPVLWSLSIKGGFMELKMNSDQEALHQRAIELCRRHRELEWQIIEVLQRIEKSKLYRKLEVMSLFQYSVKFLGLSEPTAYALINVARKADAIPNLKNALRDQTLSAAKASRILSVLTKENSADLVAFAQANSIRAIDFEVARRNPKAASRESARPISESHFEIKISVQKATLAKLQRAQALLAQKQGTKSSMAAALDAVLDDYLKRHDPVAKAERAEKKRLCKTELSAVKTNDSLPRRAPLSASEKHQVYARDGGRCTYVDRNGHRCENEQWLHIHHILPVSRGGSNDPGNLSTLCSAHHDLVHQLSFPMDGQVSWLREPLRGYG